MATTTIPIVTVIIDPIAMGLVASIARPGGNITGVTISGGLELIGKRMGLLVEAMPKLSTLGYLPGNADDIAAFSMGRDE